MRTVQATTPYDAGGRPIEVEVSGRRFDDTRVLRAWSWYRQKRPSRAVPTWPALDQTLADLETP